MRAPIKRSACPPTILLLESRVEHAPEARASLIGGENTAAGGLEADDGVRTRDPQLGKLMLYQLSYVRARSLQVTHFRSWGESPKMSFHRVLRFN